jgi:hypothetical protein
LDLECMYVKYFTSSICWFFLCSGWLFLLYGSVRFWVIFVFVRALIRWAFLEFFSILRCYYVVFFGCELSAIMKEAAGSSEALVPMNET